MPLPYDDVDVRPAHALDEVGDVGGRRVNPGPELNRSERLHPEALREVAKARVVADELLALQRRRRLPPARDPLVERRVVGGRVLLEDRRLLGEVARQPVGDRPDHELSPLGIEVDVMISYRVDVPESAVDPGGHLERGHVDGRINIAGGVSEDPGIPSLLEEAGQEGVLTLQPDQQEDVRSVEQHRETRFHWYVVNIFDAGGEARDLDEVAP